MGTFPRMDILPRICAAAVDGPAGDEVLVVFHETVVEEVVEALEFVGFEGCAFWVGGVVSLCRKYKGGYVWVGG